MLFNSHVITCLIFLIASSLFSCSDLEDFETFGEIDPEVDNKEILSIVPVSISLHQIMTFQNNLYPHPQGGDCWGDFFFQFTNNNESVRVYNLAEQKLIQEFKLKNEDRGFVSNCHCNSVCFGPYFYDDNDEFPLLYVSTGYSCDGYSGALVYRITKSDELFAISLVQTLRFPALEVSWTEFIPIEGACFVCYSDLVYKMNMPSVHDGNVIIDGSKGAIELFRFPSRPKEMRGSSNQGRMYHNGKILFPSGIPPGEQSVLVVLDMKTRTYEHVFSLPELGLHYEAESIFIWRDHLCVAFLDQIVAFDFTPNIL